MRDLTEEELKLAPDWATHYVIDVYKDEPIYESINLCWWFGLNEPFQNCTFNSVRSKPIVRNSFDISGYQFTDNDIRLSNICNSKMELAVDDCGIEHYFTLNKDDAIAIAKYFCLTAEDLK